MILPSPFGNVEARSVAALGTSILLPSHNIAFDMGWCPERAHKCEYVFVTHGHMDHIAALAMHCSRRALNRLPPPTYIVGPENHKALLALFDAYRLLDRTDLPCTVLCLTPGDQHAVSKSLQVSVFRSYHRVPTQGYVVKRVKRRLRTDLQAFTGAEIRRLAQAGEQVNQWEIYPEVAFSGDSTIDIVDREEDVRNAKLLILECTYISTEGKGSISVEEARYRGHIHMDEIAARAHLFKNERILLTHFSPRYSHEEIREAAQALPSILDGRVTLLLDEVP